MRVFNFLITFFVVYFSIPVVLILISWNTLPGQKLYRVKTVLEGLVLILTSKTPLASRLSISFTERRFSEASRLLTSEGSVVGFELLVSGAEASSDIIVKKVDAVQAEVLVGKIEKFQEEIEDKKEIAIAQSQLTSLPTRRVDPATKPTPTPQVLQTTPPVQQELPKPKELVGESPRPSTQEVVSTLEQTQARLEEIKKEIKRVIPEVDPFDKAQGGQVEEGRERREKKGERDNNDKSEKSGEQDKNKE